MNAIEFAHQRGCDRIAALLEHYSALPPSVRIITISPSHTSATVVVTLPTLPETHPLFALTRVELSYKRSGFLGSSTQLTQAASSSPTVEFQLKGLSPGRNTS